ncbi:tripartite tricarboxylate transporter substrate binding protein [Pseudorhodoferax sp. Leaf265]|jgi:tripartite-type tricarboxylate transporter receptor subunit TctC|uniref:tripartite tricarboxylate transporter substrate binding protein n=1 Tax=Pseudorhodoferax sp. Leaf265 TaxID=1736315 RepID=UPI0006F858DF|nr:tripartite tricarboxylate transporter substrate binding protein [Pseudorhodoferax sp. Leaf265]KQP14527.1 ABC transporter substrate-binding protein [Pseudorhodoferax sp. Leaf265]
MRALKTTTACTRRAAAAALLALAGVLPMAQAADYPDKPVRIIVPYAPGGGADTAARAIGQRLTEVFGQSFIVENKAGAATQTGTLAVVRAAPDGYTLLLGTANLATNAVLFDKLPYDAQRDLAPISLITKAPVYVVVHAESPVKDLKGLIAQTRSTKDGLSYGTAGNGSIPHLAGELFRASTDARLLHVPYKGSSEAVAALVGKQIDLSFDNLPPTNSMIKAGKLRPLAVAAARRSALLPEVPTTGELGVPMEASSWWGLLAPAGTPPAIVAKLNKAMVEALATPQMREHLARLGIEPESCSPAEFTALIKAETEKWGRVAKSASIKAD